MPFCAFLLVVMVVATMTITHMLAVLSIQNVSKVYMEEKFNGVTMDLCSGMKSEENLTRTT